MQHAVLDVARFAHGNHERTRVAGALFKRGNQRRARCAEQAFARFEGGLR